MASLANAFSKAADALFADPNFGRSARFFESADDDEGIAVTVIATQIDEDAGLFRTDVLHDGYSILVRTSEVATQPVEGSRFLLLAGELDGRTFRVRTARSDETEDVWDCDVDEIPSGS